MFMLSNCRVARWGALDPHPSGCDLDDGVAYGHGLADDGEQRGNRALEW
jgi:hypothetical protein